MATYTATGDGCLKAAIVAAEVMLSRCAEVQTFLGLIPPDEAAALTAIKVNSDVQPTDHDERTAAELAALRPRVFVFGNPETGWEEIRDGVGSWDTRGELLVVLERALTVGEYDDDALWILAMQTTLGRITDELRQQEAADAAVVISGITSLGPFRVERTGEEDLGGHCKGVLAISVGVGRND